MQEVNATIVAEAHPVQQQILGGALARVEAARETYGLLLRAAFPMAESGDVYEASTGRLIRPLPAPPAEEQAGPALVAD